MRENIEAILIVLGVIVLLALVILPFVTGRNRLQPQVGKLQGGNSGSALYLPS
jgi:hypothetical protein